MGARVRVLGGRARLVGFHLCFVRPANRGSDDGKGKEPRALAKDRRSGGACWIHGALSSLQWRLEASDKEPLHGLECQES
jgi:hypothetical protein